MIQSVRSAELILEIQSAIKTQLTVGPREFFTITEATKILGISRTHLYYLRKAGKLEAKVIGARKLVITKKSIDALVFGEAEQM